MDIVLQKMEKLQNKGELQVRWTYNILNTVSLADWHLVQYVEDGLWEVCPQNHIKHSKGQCFAKWSDGRWYMAKIVNSGGKYWLRNKDFNLKDTKSYKR